MTGKRHSYLWNISKDELQHLKDQTKTVVELCEKLNINPYNGSVRTLYRIAKEYNISLLYDRRYTRPSKIIAENAFKENSEHSRSVIRKYILKNKIIDYKCYNCDNEGLWCGKELSLQLEHINGVFNDHRLENLCWLCPNCHSQTNTYAGRKNKGKKTAVKKPSVERKKKFYISKEELKRCLDDKISYRELAKRFNVSDNAIRKRAKLFGLI